MKMVTRDGERRIFTNKRLIEDLETDLGHAQASIGYLREDVKQNAIEAHVEMQHLRSALNDLYEHLGLERLYQERQEIPATWKVQKVKKK